MYIFNHQQSSNPRYRYAAHLFLSLPNQIIVSQASRHQLCSVVIRISFQPLIYGLHFQPLDDGLFDHKVLSSLVLYQPVQGYSRGRLLSDMCLECGGRSDGGSRWDFH